MAAKELDPKISISPCSHSLPKPVLRSEVKIKCIQTLWESSGQLSWLFAGGEKIIVGFCCRKCRKLQTLLTQV